MCTFLMLASHHYGLPLHEVFVLALGLCTHAAHNIRRLFSSCKFSVTDLMTATSRRVRALGGGVRAGAYTAALDPFPAYMP